MSIRHLEHFFEPASVAVIGATTRPGSVGATVLANLAGAGFRGEIWPVNPHYRSIDDLRAYAGVARLPHAPDLAVICTPAAAVPSIVARSDLNGKRLGRILMDCMIEYCRGRGLATVRGAALSDNVHMHALARACGFQLLPASDGTVEMRLALEPPH